MLNLYHSERSEGDKEILLVQNEIRRGLISLFREQEGDNGIIIKLIN